MGSARFPESRLTAALMWPKATPFCGGHFVPKQGLKKGWQKKRKGRASLDSTEAASRLTRRGSDAGAAVLGGRGQGNEHAASRRSAWGAGAELGF